MVAREMTNNLQIQPRKLEDKYKTIQNSYNCIEFKAFKVSNELY